MKPAAVVISDLHLSLLRPACRADKDWMEVQASYLDQVNVIRYELNPIKRLPILCAGDIFDRWNAPPELINFALKHLPDGMICVPGQHDLPNHRYDDVHRSGYGVLKQTGKIEDVHQMELIVEHNGKCSFSIHGFGWGQPVQPRKETAHLLQVALIHQYCWTSDLCYPGAPQEANASAFKKQLKGYDVAVFGDNHQSFTTKCGDCNVLNTGGFIRRKSDEIDRVPCIGIIYDDGTVKRKKLDTSIDVFQDVQKDRPEVPLDLKEFIEGLEGLGEHGLNFVEAVERHLKGDDIDLETKDIILKALAK